MSTNEVIQLKLESSQQIIKIYASDAVKITHKILYLKKDLDKLSAKKKRTQDEEKKITEHQANLKAAKEHLEETETLLEITRSMIEAYSKNESVQI